MPSSSVRNRIAGEAARLLYKGQATECFQAKQQAARQIASSHLQPEDLPSDAEVQDQLRRLSRRIEEDQGGEADRWKLFESLLLPLEHVRENPLDHPESDALYHSLQVFEEARNRLPYDEEFLLAALLHDVGKAIDPQDPIAAGLEALDGFVSERTAWLIANQSLGHRKKAGDLGVRARRRLREHPYGDDLELLTECDEQGRCPGVAVAELEEALAYVRSLETMFDG